MSGFVDRLAALRPLLPGRAARRSRDGEARPEPAPAVPELARLHALWTAWRGAAPLPHRWSINPLELGFCLANLALVDIEPETRRPRYRLVGTGLVDLWGRELRGRYIDQVYRFPVRREVLNAYRRVMASGEPLYGERIFNLGFRRLGYHRLMLPFTDGSAGGGDGRRVDLVMLAIYPTDRRIRRVDDWRELAEDPRPRPGFFPQGPGGAARLAGTRPPVSGS